MWLFRYNILTWSILMIKHIYKYIGCLVISAIVGCATDENRIFTGTGTITLDIGIDPAVESTVSGCVCEDAPDPTDMSIRLTSADGRYSGTWKSLVDFPAEEVYASGAYRIEASYGDMSKEGPESPCYYGSTEFNVRNGESASVSVTCSLANVMLSMGFSDSFRERYTEYSAVLHSIGHGYVEYGMTETRPVYMHPGDIQLTISLTNAEGKLTKFHPTTLRNARACHHYNVFFDIQPDTDGTPMLVLDVDDELVSDDVVFRLDDILLNSAIPDVKTDGFVDGECVVHDEGDGPLSPLRFLIDAESGIRAVTLTTVSPSLVAQGWPQEVDLAAPAAGTADVLNRFGLQYECDPAGKKAIVDLTSVLKHIICSDAVGESVFTLVVQDKFKKVNNPVVMRVDTRPVLVEVIDPVESMICDSEATVCIRCGNSNVASNLKAQVFDNGVWADMGAVNCVRDPESADIYRLTMPVEPGGRDQLFRLCYNDIVKSTGTIQRKSPPYSIAVDAFAHGAVIKIDADNKYVGYLTDHLTVYANGLATAVLSRDRDRGLVCVGSLTEGKDYYVSSTAMAENDSPAMSNTVSVRTENAILIPNGDFEDAKQVVTDYTLPSGGRYSASTAPIFNQQNTTDVNVWLPADGKWCTVNDKTFCLQAKNPNTWYMQVSTAISGESQSGSKAMKMTSVGWDLDGEPIRDYVQESVPYTNYSRAIPKVSHISAGRLFLGKYNFDPLSETETYTEGIPFGSRPSALNGYFKYTPGAVSPQERGLARIVVIGESDGQEIVVAQADYLFHTTTDYTAFSIPLEYAHFGVKAKRLQVLFSSTEHIGSIDEESGSIQPYYDPSVGAAIGASLYIDNLSLSY